MSAEIETEVVEENFNQAAIDSMLESLGGEISEREEISEEIPEKIPKSVSEKISENVSPESVPPEGIPEDFETLVGKWRSRLIEENQPNYNLTDEQLLEFADSPGKVLPGLLAGVAADVTQRTTINLLSQLPRIFQLMQANYEAGQKTTTKFFEEYPALKNLEKDVYETARIYRAQHPDASYEEAAKNVAAIVAVKNRVSLTPAKSVKPQVPFTPAPSASIRQSSGKSGKNPMELFIEDALRDD